MTSRMGFEMWFMALLVSGVGCGVFALGAVVLGYRRGSAELALLGTALTVASLGMGVHGWLGMRLPADLGDIGLRLAVPASVVLLIPVLRPRTSASRWLLSRWRPVTVTALVAGLAVVSIDVISPGHRMPTSISVFLAVATLLGGAAIAHRQWYLYRIGQQRSSMIAAFAILAYTWISVAAQWVEPASTLGWLVIGLDASALVVAVGALMVGHRVGTDVSEVLAPVIAHEPLAMLEVGLAPEVRSFVAALGDTDDTTRYHVIRTSALATRIAMRAGLRPHEVRDVALGALLHDIGKLLVPIEILNKPAALTADEFEIIKQHPRVGAEILRGVPSLTSVAHIVAQHHERPDGRGYPDALSDHELSVAGAIVSACDAWDAMVENRPYRQGMAPERAAAIITEGAGTQWRADIVEYLLQETSVQPHTDAEQFGTLTGHEDAYLGTIDCTCGDTAPRPVGRPQRSGVFLSS